MVKSAQYEENGNLYAVINGVAWSGITTEHRFYEAIQEWVAAGNTITPYQGN